MSTTLGAFTAGGIAGCGAVTFSHSFETVKIRLQLQGELQAKGSAPKSYNGVLHGMGQIVRNEGVRGLFRGLNCAVCYSLPCFRARTDKSLAVYLPTWPQRLPSRLL